MRELAQKIVKIWHSEQIIRYGICGGGNMVLDWVLYFIMYNFVVGHEIVNIHFSAFGFQFEQALTPHIAALCIVFPITLLTGFLLQKYVTFTQSKLNSWRQLVR